MKKLLTVLLLGTLVVSGCARYTESQPSEEAAYSLYFRAGELKDMVGDGALQEELVYLPEIENMPPREKAAILLEELLKGPLNLELESAIPAGTTLNSIELSGSRALVDLSMSYGGLSGIALTLADFAVTLTLTQLPEISSVKITVRGQELAYRDQQVFTDRDVQLAPQGDVVATVEAWLYFLDENSMLTAEHRMLQLHEGDTQVTAVAKALGNGPESKELFDVMPEVFRVKSVWQEDDICYVNLSSALLRDVVGDPKLSTALQALGRSLCSLETVSETRFLVDGEYAEHYGSVSIADPYIG